jgi:hypothetical protein
MAALVAAIPVEEAPPLPTWAGEISFRPQSKLKHHSENIGTAVERSTLIKDMENQLPVKYFSSETRASAPTRARARRYVA